MSKFIILEYITFDSKFVFYEAVGVHMNQIIRSIQRSCRGHVCPCPAGYKLTNNEINITFCTTSVVLCCCNAVPIDECELLTASEDH